MSSMLKEVGWASEGASEGPGEGESLDSPALTTDVFDSAEYDGRRMIFWSAFEGYLHSSDLNWQFSHDGLVS